MRVLFQMSAADSSTLIDLPLAGKLGPQRACSSARTGPLEKFRPYGAAVGRVAAVAAGRGGGAGRDAAQVAGE